MATSTNPNREILPLGPTRGQLTDRPRRDPPSGATMAKYAIGVALLFAIVAALAWLF